MNAPGPVSDAPAAPQVLMQCLSDLLCCVLTDSHAPTWTNNLDGIINLRDALKRTITYSAPNGKFYKLRSDAPVATLLVR